MMLSRLGALPASALVLVLLGASAAADPSAPRSLPLAADRARLAARCLARCDELDTQCKTLEQRQPTCTTDDVCLEEKLRCEAACRVPDQS